MEDISTQFDSIINISKSIFNKKLDIYGCSWRVLRISSVIDQIFIKIKRIHTINKKGINKVDEDISEDFLSILNYSIIGLIQLFKNISFNDDLSKDDALKYYISNILKAKKIIINKNHDYNNVWKEMKMESIIDMILQKLLRIKKINNYKKKEYSKEKYIEENLLDIINYAILSLIKMNFKSD